MIVLHPPCERIVLATGKVLFGSFEGGAKSANVLVGTAPPSRATFPSLVSYSSFLKVSAFSLWYLLTKAVKSTSSALALPRLTIVFTLANAVFIISSHCALASAMVLLADFSASAMMALHLL